MTDTWPPRWTKPMFKEPTSKKVGRALKRKKALGAENENKKEVRTREKHRCRFPLCGCKKLNFALHVSHSKHKGIGGNPKGDRSDPALMVLVCAPRHREARISIDRGTLRWRELEAGKGAAGPIAWDIRADEVPRKLLCEKPRDGKLIVLDEWLELAREVKRGEWAPIDAGHAAILKWLASMEV